MNKILQSLNTLFLSVAAGIMISIGATIYIKCPNKIVGAFMFSIGLIAIMLLGFKLYTGVVGYAFTKRQWLQIPNILLGNFIGAVYLRAWITPEDVEPIVNAKLQLPFLTVYSRAVLCGMLIFIAVEAFKKWSFHGLPITALAVATFILTGAEHSIADMCYFLASNISASDIPHAIGFIIDVIVGNAVGAITLGVLSKYKLEETNCELSKNNK